MKFTFAIGILVTCVLLVGCNGNGDTTTVAPRAPMFEEAPTSEDVDGDLKVTLETAKRTYHVGEACPVTLAAINTGSSPITVTANSGALFYIRVWVYTGIGWDVVHRYPQAATMQIQTWTLAPGETREFEMTLPVEPTWPSNQPLRLQGFLNGRAQAAPYVGIEVLPRPNGQDAPSAQEEGLDVDIVPATTDPKDIH
jgi:hypothetical protein